LPVPDKCGRMTALACYLLPPAGAGGRKPDASLCHGAQRSVVMGAPRIA
jgi:hypothetical protein